MEEWFFPNISAVTDTALFIVTFNLMVSRGCMARLTICSAIMRKEQISPGIGGMTGTTICRREVAGGFVLHMAGDAIGIVFMIK